MARTTPTLIELNSSDVSIKGSGRRWTDIELSKRVPRALRKIGILLDGRSTGRLRQLIYWHRFHQSQPGPLTHKQAKRDLEHIRAVLRRAVVTIQRKDKATLNYLASYETLSLPHEQLAPLMREVMFGRDREYRPGPNHQGIVLLNAGLGAIRALTERIDSVLLHMKSNGELAIEKTARKSALTNSAFSILVEMILHFWMMVLDKSPTEKRRGRHQISADLIDFAAHVYCLTGYCSKIGEAENHIKRALEDEEWKMVLYGPYTFGDHTWGALRNSGN